MCKIKNKIFVERLYYDIVKQLLNLAYYISKACYINHSYKDELAHVSIQ